MIVFRKHLGLAWAVVKARTFEWGQFNMDLLREQNLEFATWFALRVKHCATCFFLPKQVTRRGMVSTNPAEQNNSSVVPERALPIIDLIHGLMKKMARNSRERTDVARACVLKVFSPILSYYS